MIKFDKDKLAFILFNWLIWGWVLNIISPGYSFDAQLIILQKVLSCSADVSLHNWGNKKSILALSYSGLGKIRAETILLQNKKWKIKNYLI
jgi:hypothetical protein